MRAKLKLFPALLLSLLVAGCGGGGSASFDGGSATGNATVGLVITDAPVGGWDEAIATITSVKLIGDAGQATLFSGSQTLDLLKLGDFSEFFAVSDRVPAGSYSKIRLQLSDLVLNDLDVDGTLIRSEQPKLVGNGKIDLNPRGPFRLESGDSIVIELDFDMEKSLKITETGNGKLIIRPVVFVDIRTYHQLPERLTRIYGEITDIDYGSGDFRLCQTGFASHWDGDDEPGDDDHFTTDRRCVLVHADADTGIFDEDGFPQDFAGLAVGEKVTAIGRLLPLEVNGAEFGDSGADDDLYRFALDAFVVEEGPLGTYRRIAGTVATPVNLSLDQFGLDVAPGQGISTGGPLPVQLYGKSRIFSRAGHELARADIVAGRGALVDGILVIGSEDLIRSPLVVLREDDPSEADNLRGTIVSVDEDGQGLLVNDGSMDRCVDAAGARIFLVDTSDGFSSEQGDLGDLSPGQSVVVFGAEQVDGCLQAGTILAQL